MTGTAGASLDARVEEHLPQKGAGATGAAETWTSGFVGCAGGVFRWGNHTMNFLRERRLSWMHSICHVAPGPRGLSCKESQS